MLRALHTGIIIASLLALFTIASARPLHLDIVLPRNMDVEPFLADEGSIRSERSANISHIIGVSRKIQLIVNKIMFLQISPDGSVNGTDNDNDYTVLQRASLNNYQIRIQGVVTCNFLCMDRCGLLYGSKEFTDDCVFNEMMESHHFNTYSSAKYSNDKRTLYLALNKKGNPRKVQTKAKASLGKLETYTNVLTKPVASERVEALAFKIAKARMLLGKFLQGIGIGEESHVFRHHRYQFCPNVPMTKSEDKKGKLKCKKREKKKKKRKCGEDETEEDDCFVATAAAASATTTSTMIAAYKKKTLEKCEEDEEEEDCQKRWYVIRQKRKSRAGSETNTGKCPQGGKCADIREKKKRKRIMTEKKKMASVDKTIHPKCANEIGCNRKGPKENKENSKGPRKEKINSQSRLSNEDSPMLGSLLWRDVFGESNLFSNSSWSRSSTWLEIATEKILDDYEDEDPSETEDEISTETDWPLQSSSFSHNRD